MVVYMSIASLTLVIAGIGIAYDISNRNCNPFWLFLREFSFISSVFWAAYYAYSLKEIITNYLEVSLTEIEKQGFLVAVVAPMICSAIFFIASFHKELGFDCYITLEGRSPSFKYMILFGFLVPICGAFGFSVYCYIRIGLELWMKAPMEGEINRILKELVLFPIALFVCCLFPVLNTIFMVFLEAKLPTFILLHHIFQQSTGLINALAYGLKYASYVFIKNQLRNVKRTFQSVHNMQLEPEQKSDSELIEIQERLVGK